MHQKSRGMALALGLVVGVVLTLTPVTGHALGLGKLKVHSALNEPLNAEIEFTSISEKELKGLNASLASYADFRAAGAERLPFLSQIKFTVAKRLDGRYFLQLRTDQQIEEPFLHLLIQLEWRGGRLVREYTALIDPPYHVAGKPTGIEVPRTAPSVKAEPPPVEPVPVAKVEEAPKVEPKPTPEPAKEATPPKKKVTAAREPAPPMAPAKEDLLGPSVRDEAVISKATGWPEDFVSEEVASVEKESPEEAPKVELLGPPIAEADVPAPKPAPAKTVSTWATASEYTVKKGDTLWEIADKIRSDKQLSMEQIILAIFKANQHAFFGNNVNNLKAGKILKIPERETVASIPGPQARREFRAQYDVWQEYKLKLASASRAIKVSEAVTQPEPVKTETKKAEAKPAKPAKEAAKPTKPEKKTAQKKAESKPQKSAAAPADKGKQPDELLKIVRATLESEKTDPDKKVAEKEAIKADEKKERAALAERVTALEESLESKEMETKELGEKIGQVRSQIKKESRLIELESQGLAQVEKKAPEVKPETPAKSADKAEAPAEAPKPAPTADKPVKVEKAAPVRKKRAAPPPPPKEEKNFITKLMDDALAYDSLLPVVGGAAVLIGGVIMLVYMRRRRRSIAEFEESILSDAITTDTGDTGTVTSDTSGQAVTTGDTSFLSDFSQGGMGNIHTDEVDPIAEAEVYLAYGRDETAEEILKEAIVKNPERHELKQKLLEIYHQRNDVAAFETLAEELYAALGGRGGKVWDKVEEMGRKLNPENPMFRGGAPAKSITADTDTKVSAPAPMMGAMPDAQTDLQTPPTSAKATETVVDMDFDVGTSEATAPAAQEPSTEVSAFDLDLGAETAAAPSEDTGAAEQLGQEDLGQPDDHAIEFDVGESAPAEVTDVDVAAKLAEGGEEDIKFDVESAAPVEAAVEPSAAPASEETPTEEGQQQWDETATKLDLAKAYIDMGDAEGARSILDEVLAEGNESQKQQAAELAAQIS